MDRQDHDQIEERRTSAAADGATKSTQCVQHSKAVFFGAKRKASEATEDEASYECCRWC